MTATTPPPLRDRLGRPLRDLRVSVTDRCNFRCRYCMPREVFGADFQFLPRDQILSFEEITQVVAILHGRGLRKLRLTGGEPLLRSGLPALVAMLRALPGLEIALTTNGSLLAAQAADLAAAGLDRVTVSLDSIDDAVFRAMNDVETPVAQVLAGIEAAAAAGLGPIKINAVVRRGVNDHTLVDLARHFHGSGHSLRFIEYMDVGASNGWRLDDVVPGAEILRRIDAALPLEPVEPAYRGEVARRWRYRDGGGEVGVITSVSQPFLRRLHAGPAVGRGRALHLPLRDPRHGLARPAARRRPRRPAAGTGGGLVGARGPLLGAARGRHARAARAGPQDRDVVHRWLRPRAARRAIAR